MPVDVDFETEHTPLVPRERNFRDLDQARSAYTSRDQNLSRLVHQKKDFSFHDSHGHSHDSNGDFDNPDATHHDGKPEVGLLEDGHHPEGEFIKSIVFGGLDGILTTFAIVSGSAGGDMSLAVVLVLGFSSKFADALSMGLGDALSTKAEHEHILNERQREYWEYDSFPAGEKKEMIDLYVAKGMSVEDAERIIDIMAPHRDFFVDLMMVQELGLQVPDEDDVMSPWKDGLVTFSSFIFFGFFPLAGYVVFPFIFPNLTPHELFLIACASSLTTLFSLGIVKSMFSKKTWYRSGFEMMAIGGLVAMIAYGAGAATKVALAWALGQDLESLPNLE